MAGMTKSCSVCGARFDVQFRYQMKAGQRLRLLLLADCHGRRCAGDDRRRRARRAASVLPRRARMPGRPCPPRAVRVPTTAGGKSRPRRGRAAGGARGAASARRRSLEPTPRLAAAAAAFRLPRFRPRAKRTRSMLLRAWRSSATGAARKDDDVREHRAGLASRGMRVLLVDTDSQGEASASRSASRRTDGSSTCSSCGVRGIQPQFEYDRISIS